MTSPNLDRIDCVSDSRTEIHILYLSSPVKILLGSRKCIVAVVKRHGVIEIPLKANGEFNLAIKTQHRHNPVPLMTIACEPMPVR